jgi:hypothetical protein
MQTRLIDHLRDAAGAALELFRDRYKEDATEADLITALLHRVDGSDRDEDVASVYFEANGAYHYQLLVEPVIDLGGTKRED